MEPDFGARLHEALKWAVELHFGQDRDPPAPLPYVTHPIEVVRHLRRLENVQDEDILCAAMLHDVIEETEATIAEVEKRFGKRVALILGEVTREEPSAEVAAKISAEELYALRNKLLLAEIEAMSSEAMLIKLADRLSNLVEAESTRTGKKLERYRKQSRQMLKIIPKSVGSSLWSSIDDLLKSAGDY